MTDITRDLTETPLGVPGDGEKTEIRAGDFLNLPVLGIRIEDLSGLETPDVDAQLHQAGEEVGRAVSAAFYRAALSIYRAGFADGQKALAEQVEVRRRAPDEQIPGLPGGAQ